MLTVADDSGAAGTFPEHEHGHHELLWGATGAFGVEADGRMWVVPPMFGVWVPAGVTHGGFIGAEVQYFCTFFDPATCRPPWRSVTPVVIPRAARELILWVHEDGIEGAAHARAERVVFDAVRPATVSAVVLPMPFDDRARRVAAGLLEDPADRRTLRAWGDEVGSSTRHLTRLFEVQTGMTFVRWRTNARVRAALALLAAGNGVAATGRAVGFQTTSSFVRAFGAVVGQTPGSFLAGVNRQRVTSEDALHRRRRDAADVVFTL